MKKLLLLLLLTPVIHAQVRWDYSAQTIGNPVSGSTGGSKNPLVPILGISSAQITFCGYSSPGGPCNVPVTTYTTAAGGGTCSISTPLTRPNSPGCFATADAAGNFGAWFNAGQAFGYTIISSLGTFGPFPANAAGGGSGSSGFPITLGSTSIAASSTTTSVAGLTVNGVALNAAGSSSLFLNQAGGYTTPGGGCTSAGTAGTVQLSNGSGGCQAGLTVESAGGGGGLSNLANTFAGQVEYLVSNGSTASSAYSTVAVGSGSNQSGFNQLSTGWTPTSFLKPAMGYWSTQAGAINGILINTETTAPLALATNGVARLTFDGTTGVATFTDNVVVNTGGPVNSFQVGTNLFSALPSCTSGVEGTQAPVTDSTTNTWGATITGSGSDHVLAYCDGSVWSVAAK